MGKGSETSAGHPSFLPPLLFFLSFLLSVRLLCMGWRRRRRSTLFYPFYLKQRFSVTARRENGDEEVESEGRRRPL